MAETSNWLEEEAEIAGKELRHDVAFYGAWAVRPETLGFITPPEYASERPATTPGVGNIINVDFSRARGEQ